MSARILVSASLLASVFIACSGATPTDLYDSTGSSQFGTNPAPSASNGNGTGMNGGGGGGSGGGTDPGGGGGGGSGGGGGGSGADAGSGGTTDAGSGVDSGGGTTTGPGIYCGADSSSKAVYCSTKSQECCGTKAFGDPNVSYACVGNGSACGGIPIHCDDRTDCPSNQVCCGTFDQMSGYVSVECKTACNGNGGGTTGVRMCDPGAATDECASIGKTCSQSGSLTGFYRCN